MLKVNNGLSVQLVREHLHSAENHCNFRHQSGIKFKVNYVNTEKYGKQSLSYLGSKIWQSIPQEKKNVIALVAFKTKIKL